MKKINIKNPHFRLVDSTLKGCKEVEVVFNYNGKNYKHFIFIKEDKNVNYLKEAKKQFNQDLKLGKVLESINTKPSNSHPWLIASTAVLGVAALTLGGLFTWKMLTGNNYKPSPAPSEIEYEELPTRRILYMSNPIGAYYKKQDITFKYNNAGGMLSSISTIYQNDGKTILNIDTVERELDQQNRLIHQHNLKTDAEGTPTMEQDRVYVRENEDYTQNAETYNYSENTSVTATYVFHQINNESGKTTSLTSTQERFNGTDPSERTTTLKMDSESTNVYDNLGRIIILNEEMTRRTTATETKTITHTEHVYNENEGKTIDTFKSSRTVINGGASTTTSADGYYIYTSSGTIEEAQTINYSDDKWTTATVGKKYVYFLDNLGRPTSHLGYDLEVESNTWVRDGLAREINYFDDFGKMKTYYYENDINGQLEMKTISRQYDEYHRYTIEEMITKNASSPTETKQKEVCEYSDQLFPVEPHTIGASRDIVTFYESDGIDFQK